MGMTYKENYAYLTSNIKDVFECGPYSTQIHYIAYKENINPIYTNVVVLLVNKLGIIR